MSTPSIPEFWQLAALSGLVGPEKSVALQTEYSQIRGATIQANTRTLCEWLIDRRAMSRFQCEVLLTGQPGPFHYGDYLLVDRIAVGRLSGLFKASHLPTGEPVLLYFLGGPQAQNEQALATVRTAAAAWSQLDDPHLAACYEFVETGAYKFIVVESLSGQSAAERLNVGGGISVAEACALARSAALALSKIHAAGMVHGDVRSENLWNNAVGDGLLLGFPLARDPLGPGPALEARTVDYAAPELANIPAVLTSLSDIYALGCTLYELLTGLPPFGDTTQPQSIPEKMARHATEAIQPIAGAPEELNQVVRFMMAKNSAIRFQTAAAVADALRTFAGGADGAAKRPGPATLRAFYRQRHLAAPPGPGGLPVSSPALQAAMQPRATQSSSTAPSGHGLTAGASIAAPPISGTPMRPIPSAPAPSNPTPLAGAAQFLGSAFVSSAATAQASGARTAAGSTTQTLDPAGPVLDELLMYEPSQLTNATRLPLMVEPAEAKEERLRRQAARRRKMIVGALAVVAVGLLVGALLAVQRFYQRGSAKLPEQAVAESGKNSNDQSKAKGTSVAPEKPAGQPDDGLSLWSSPTRGEPPHIKYVASGVQILAVLRPQTLLDASRGRQAIDAMGPAGQLLLGWIETRVGVKPEAIDRLDIAIYEGYAPQPLLSLVAYVKDRPAEAELVTRWGNPTPVQQAGHKYYQTKQ